MWLTQTQTISLNFHHLTYLSIISDEIRNNHNENSNTKPKKKIVSQADLVLCFDLIVIYLLHCQTVATTAPIRHTWHTVYAHFYGYSQIINDMEMSLLPTTKNHHWVVNRYITDFMHTKQTKNHLPHRLTLFLHQQ